MYIDNKVYNSLVDPKDLEALGGVKRTYLKMVGQTCGDWSCVSYYNVYKNLRLFNCFLIHTTH